MEDDILNFLKENESGLPQAAQTAVSKLTPNCDEFKFYKYVYTVLHHITVNLENEKDDQKFFTLYDVCVKCLEYVVDNWNDEQDIPNCGIEKLSYQLIKQADSKFTSQAVDILLNKLEQILTILLQLVQSKPTNNNEVLKYIYNKVRSLEVKLSTCNCHEVECTAVKFARCKLFALVLYSAAGNGITTPMLVQYLINLAVAGRVEKTKCRCHLFNISKVLLLALDYTACLPAKTVVKPLVNMISMFAALQGMNSGENKKCTKHEKVDLSQVLEDFYKTAQEIGKCRFELKEDETEQLSKLLSKVLNEILKFIEKKKTDSTMKVCTYNLHTNLFNKWSTILPLALKLAVCDVFYVNEIPDPNVVMTSLFLFYHRIHSSSRYREEMIPLVSELVRQACETLTGLETSKLEYCLQCIMSICITAFNSKVQSHILLCIPLNKLHYQICMKRTQVIQVKTILINRCTLFKMLQRVGKNKRAMNEMALFVSGNPLDEESASEIMEQWVRCKMALFADKKGNEISIESSTIDDYIPNNDTNLRIKLLRNELHHTKGLRQNPPTFQYHVLNKIIDVCDVTSNDCWLEKSMLCVLLHAWPGKFENAREILNLALDCASSSNWEAKVIGNFITYLSTWENSLAKVWIDKEKFVSGCENSNQAIDWFPSVYPSSHRYLISIIEACENRKGDDVTMDLIDDVIIAIRCSVSMLQISGETILSLKLLYHLDRILHCISDKDATFNTQYTSHWVAVKSQISEILSKIGMIEESMRFAKEAEKLVNDFAKYIETEGTEKSRKLFNQINIESKSAMVQALVCNDESAEARNLLCGITKDEFIDAEHRRTSHTSSLVGAKVDTLIADLGSSGWSLEAHHALVQATTALEIVYLMLKQTCPGVCNLRFFEVNPASSDPPRFGSKSSDVGVDILRQLLLLNLLFHLLHLVAELWLRAGELRSSISYITDGLMLSRTLLLHERELQFQVLLTKHARMKRDVAKLNEELHISNDAIQYLASLETSAPRKRGRLFSSIKEEDTEADAVNNSSIMEDIEVSEDEEDNFGVKSAPINVAAVVIKNNDPMASPKFQRRHKTKTTPIKSPFTHKDGCSCGFCSNLLVFNQQVELLMLSAQFLEDSQRNQEVFTFLETSLLPERCVQLSDALYKSIGARAPKGKSGNLLPIFQTKLLQMQNIQSETYFNLNDMKSALKDCQVTSMQQNTNTIYTGNTIAKTNLLRGLALFPSVQKPHVKTSLFLNNVIDALGRKEEKEENILSEIQNLCLRDKSPKPNRGQIVTQKVVTPIKAAKSIRAISQLEFVTPARTIKQPRPATSVKKTPRVKIPKTPATKSIRKPQSTKKITKSKTGFDIFEEDVPTVSLSVKKEPNKKSKMPVPDLPPTHDVKPKSSRRVVFESSSDESFHIMDTITEQAPPSRVQPRRRAKSRNIMTSRREARMKYREEEGEVYTDEDPEDERPTRRTKTTKIRIHDESQDERLDDVELIRERTVGETPVQPLRQPIYDITMANNDNCSEQESEYYLNEAFKLATNTGNFEIAKTSSKILAWHHYRNGDHWGAAASHLLSIGVTFRSIACSVAHARVRMMDRAKKKRSGNTEEPTETKVREALVDMAECTHPSHVISCSNEPENYIKRISEKLPTDWSICAISLVEKNKHFELLMTRIRKGESPLYIQTDGNEAKKTIDVHNLWSEQNVNGMKTTDRVLWWTQRRNSQKNSSNNYN
uniref:uncharacterized protein LOC100185242 isoform X2 n=1 Tax=Ciona intestinalis TaxID=7719 RepID=UPI000EF49553|nr:uncharacterized protein LOC100185242 isoform X2 [Ciona intestinalis]|eukprot:XP_026694185.1 uncharacterized protein LOC100185242 isoform X2 [Ciona intestinalis]